MNAKNIVFGSIGFLIGAGAGYALATFIYENMMEEEEIFIDEDEELLDNEEELDIETVVPQEYKGRKHKRTDYTQMYQGKDKPNLDTLAKKLRDELEEEDDVVTEELDERPDPSKPYLISREQFEEEFVQAHKKNYYHYYEDDDVLTQAEDEMVITSQPDKFLGPEALDSFGMHEADPDFVHVRNEILGSDYEIQLIHGSFEKMITSVKKEKRTRKDRPTRVVEEEVDE